MKLLGQGVGAGLNFPSIAVQFPYGFDEERKGQALRYLEDYKKNIIKTRAYFGEP